MKHIILGSIIGLVEMRVKGAKRKQKKKKDQKSARIKKVQGEPVTSSITETKAVEC